MKKPSLRMCLCCREMMDKKELKRVVKTPEGKIMLDLSGKMNGRGAYICQKPECLKKLKKQKVLNKAFSVQIDDEIYDKIIEAVESGEF
ncbi:MAG: RNase P modulator RnpM [Christensenellales bacterium]